MTSYVATLPIHYQFRETHNGLPWKPLFYLSMLSHAEFIKTQTLLAIQEPQEIN